MNEIEHTCQFCYYEYFNPLAYPCSMCVCGEERKDMFMPKGRENKRKDESQIYCDTCGLNKKCGVAFTEEARHCQNESRRLKDEPQIERNE